MKKLPLGILSFSILFAASCKKNDNQTPISPANNGSSTSQAPSKPTIGYWDVTVSSIVQSSGLSGSSLNITFNSGAGTTGSLYYALTNSSGVITGAWSPAYACSGGHVSIPLSVNYAIGQNIAVYFDPGGGSYPVPLAVGYQVNSAANDHADFAPITTSNL